jgi:hypothetical protein
MEITRDSYHEEFLQKQRSTAQKVFYPINLSFAFVDSNNTFNTNQRLIKPNHFLERILNIKFNSPEDNLKAFKYPVWISHIILAASFLCSSFIPFYFMTVRSIATITMDFVLCWVFWTTFFLSVSFLFYGWRKLEKNRTQRRSVNMLQQFQLRSGQIKQILSETLLIFGYTTIVFYVSDHIENIFICYVHTIAIVFRFCFKIGRSITISKGILNGFLFLIFGMIVSLFHFNILKDNYSTHKGLLSIAAAFLSGVFWLLNREDNSELNLSYKLFLVSVGNVFLSAIIMMVFYNVSMLFTFLLEYFFSLLGFTLLVLVSFYLKSKVIELYEEIIPALLYIMEPLCLYLYWEIFIRLSETYSQGHSVFAEFFAFFFFKLCFVFIFLILGQLLIQIEMKRNEVTLHGGKLGIKTDQRDQMKYQHMDLLMKLNVDNN